MVMEFSLINVNLNIDRKLFVFVCAGLTLAVVLSDESNPAADVLRAFPPVSILRRYVIPVVKRAVGFFRGYVNAYSGSVGAKVPITPDSFSSSSSSSSGEVNAGSGDGEKKKRTRRDGGNNIADAAEAADAADAPSGEKTKRQSNADRSVGDRPHDRRQQKQQQHHDDPVRSIKDEGWTMDEDEALAAFSPHPTGGPGAPYYDEESMPKSRWETSKERYEDAHEVDKYDRPDGKGYGEGRKKRDL